MNKNFRKKILDIIEKHPSYAKVVKHLKYDSKSLQGTIEYEPLSISIPKDTPGFTGTRTKITDEEMVRAYLTLRLITDLQYKADPKIIEFERKYKAVGRPGKGGRVDIIVKHPKTEEIFLFIECKTPDKYDSDLRYIDGQLFRLSKQEKVRPSNLVYYAVDIVVDSAIERIILIDTSKYPEFDDWDNAGQPIVDSIPANYSKAKKRRYAKVDNETTFQRPLRYDTDSQTFSRLRNEIHDVIWGGGGTSNNEVFIYISKLLVSATFYVRPPF